MTTADTDDRWRAWARTVVLVEGDSDAAAITTLAARRGVDLRGSWVHVLSTHGITNFPRILAGLASAEPAVAFAGLYDEAEERHVVRALAGAGRARPVDRDAIAALGFFACVADLEDEMIRTLGAAAVEAVLDQQGELISFRRFQAQPAQRERPLDRQLRRFLGTRATRKIRYGSLLADALDPHRPPAPLQALLDRVTGAKNPPNE